MTEQSMLRRIGPIALGLALLAGCSSSQPTQFYTLSALVSDSRPDERSTIRLGVGPIALPAYLDRPQVVTRSGNSRMTVADFHQWAEPLETSFQRVLKENLSSRLGTDDVVMLPSRRGLPLDHQVEIDVTRFDADQTGEVVLDARWLIFDGRGDRLQESGPLRRQEAVRCGRRLRGHRRSDEPGPGRHECRHRQSSRRALMGAPPTPALRSKTKPLRL